MGTLTLDAYLRRGADGHHVVSPPAARLSTRYPRLFRRLARHCVSHGGLDQSEDFLKHDTDFQPHCVSHRVPRDLRAQPALATGLSRCLDSEALPQPVAAVRLGFALPPARTRLPVALALTADSAAHVLPLTSAWMGDKPAPADPARSLATHREPPTEVGENTTLKLR